MSTIRVREKPDDRPPGDAAERFQALPKCPGRVTREQVAELVAQKTRRAVADRAKADADAIALQAKIDHAKAKVAAIDFAAEVAAAQARRAELAAMVAEGKAVERQRHLDDMAEKPGPNRWRPAHTPRSEPRRPEEDAAALRAGAVRGYLEEWLAMRGGQAVVVLAADDDGEEAAS